MRGHELSLITSWSLAVLYMCSIVESFLHQTIWNGNFAVCNKWVCMPLLQSGPEPRGDSDSLYCASALTICFISPVSLLHCLTFKCVEKKKKGETVSARHVGV